MQPLFDAHCHLQHPQLRDKIVSVVARAKVAGIGEFECCGMSEADWEDVAYLASNIGGVYPSFGLHPRLIEARNEIWSEKLVDYLVRFPTAGIGEIGLDFSLTPSTHADQKRAFSSQLQMAQQLMRPVTIWCQYAWEELMATLDRIGTLPAGGVVRGYTGETSLVPKIEAHGLCISFTSWICPWYNEAPRQAVAAVSPERLLLESDTQSTLVGGSTAQAQEPSVLVEVCRAVAEIRGIGLEDVAQVTAENARRLFCIESPF